MPGSGGTASQAGEAPDKRGDTNQGAKEVVVPDAPPQASYRTPQPAAAEEGAIAEAEAVDAEGEGARAGKANERRSFLSRLNLFRGREDAGESAAGSASEAPSTTAPEPDPSEAASHAVPVAGARKRLDEQMFGGS